MSIAIAIKNKKGVDLYVDSVAIDTNGDFLVVDAEHKSFRLNRLVLGLSGTPRVLPIVRRVVSKQYSKLKLASTDKKQSLKDVIEDCIVEPLTKYFHENESYKENGGTGCAMIIGFNKDLFLIESNFNTFDLRDYPYFSIGSAAEYVIGSMDAMSLTIKHTFDEYYSIDKRVELACDIAMKYTASIIKPLYKISNY
jgi:hypothetical protein